MALAFLFSNRLDSFAGLAWLSQLGWAAEGVSMVTTVPEWTAVTSTQALPKLTLCGLAGVRVLGSASPQSWGASSVIASAGAIPCQVGPSRFPADCGSWDVGTEGFRRRRVSVDPALPAGGIPSFNIGGLSGP
jgi:hypothetical protein